ncbi:MAG TPA: CocE/NonD family hydrolase [Mycobacteriales bacterium]|nr:CocE/NonD family hydrolase [Mycobacteriales bacterium]
MSARHGERQMMPGRRRVAAMLGAALVGGVLLAASPSGAAAPRFVSKSLSFRSSDGTMLHASVGGFGSLRPRPVIVEDSPYSPDVSSLTWLGTSYNYVELQWRGTGLSDGALSTTGPADQHDLSSFLGWACRQPWSNGRLGYYGFSASAIVAYNTMHLPMPCVKAASLMAGSVDLYRDLLDIGGIPNLAAGAFVETAIGAPTLAASGQRLENDPMSGPTTLLGYPQAAVDVLGNPNEDSFWRNRTFRGDRDRIPILADTSFYDVEPRGPFLAFNATKKYGTHLLVYGAHDGHPAGTPGPFPQYRNWFDHYLLGKPLSPANRPEVSLYASKGSREEFLADHVVHLTGTTWPLRGTQWKPLYLSTAKSGTVTSVNDGTLSAHAPSRPSTQSYPFVPSDAMETDPHTIGVVAGDGIDQAARLLPALTDLQLSAPTSLTYTTGPLKHALTAVGPGAVDLSLSSTATATDIYVVVADVRPDGTAFPVATGALRTSYPLVDRSKSVIDEHGRVVDPYNRFGAPNHAAPGTVRRYQVELLPIGNQFAAGDRIRLYVLGTPVDQLASPPGLNTVHVGGAAPSRLLLPTVEGT